MHHFAQIEDALVAVLTAPLRAIEVRTITSYAGEMDVQTVEDLVHALLSRMPAVLVAADSLDVTPRNRVDSMTAEIRVVCCARDLGGNATRTGARSEPGVFEMLEIVESTLNGQIVIPGWSAFAWAGVKTLFRQPKASMCAYVELFKTQRAVR